MLHCNIGSAAYVQRTMSKPLAIAAAFSIFATSALALFAPGSAHPSDAFAGAGATSLAAPPFSVKLPSLLGS
jgi:hypothetical protein